jgi:hypothetical protein
MTEQEQLDALKAQVNCLRYALDNVLTVEDVTVDVAIAIANALKSSSEQCLAEVMAKAIEDACKEEGYTDCDGDRICPAEHLLEYANNIRKQKKKSTIT